MLEVKLLSLQIHHVQLAVDPVCQHMEQQSDANDPRNTFEKQEQYINSHCPISVQKMKIDAATVGRKNRRAQQMICVYQHRPKQNKVGFFPITSKKNVSDRYRKNQV